MKYIKLYEELNTEYKQDIDIIYRDKNLLCFLPKTYRGASLYSNKTGWCSKGSSMYSHKCKEGVLLFRFFFKDGNKIRLSVYEKNRWDWGNKSGKHVISTEKKHDTYRILNKEDVFSIEQLEPYADLDNILLYIGQIPNECREKILSIIRDHFSEVDRKDMKDIDDDTYDYRSKASIEYFNKYIDYIMNLNLYFDTNNLPYSAWIDENKRKVYLEGTTLKFNTVVDLIEYLNNNGIEINA